MSGPCVLGVGVGTACRSGKNFRKEAWARWEGVAGNQNQPWVWLCSQPHPSLVVALRVAFTPGRDACSRQVARQWAGMLRMRSGSGQGGGRGRWGGLLAPAAGLDKGQCPELRPPARFYPAEGSLGV